MPAALGACPRQLRLTPRWVVAVALVQPLPRSAAFRSEARAAVVPALVWWTTGAPAASAIASRTRTTGYPTRVETTTRSTEFVALGHPGSEHYAGLETFPNPGVSHVEMTSDELAAVCPGTRPPGLLLAADEEWPRGPRLEVQFAQA